MIAPLIYSLCAATSFSCAYLLLRAWSETRTPLLLWSGLCFVFFTISNVVLILDALVIDQNLAIYRKVPELIGTMILLFGFIWKKSNR